MPQSPGSPRGALGGFIGLIGLSAVAGVLVTASVTPAIAVSSAATTQAIGLFEGLTNVLDVNAPMEPTTLFAKNAEGDYEQIAMFYDQNRVVLTFDQVPQVVVDAVLSSEDKTFYEHGGINLGATVSALIDNILDRSSRGASTITQQYVKNVLIQECEQENADPTQADYWEVLEQCWLDASTGTGLKGFQRKLQELRYALQVEKDFSKNDILLGYLNISSFGGQTYGIEAAANLYFGLSVSELSTAQAALLVGMVQEPNTYRLDRPEGSWVDKDGVRHNGEMDGYASARDRRDYVLDMMLENGKITASEHRAAIAEPIVPNLQEPQAGCAASGTTAYFCQYVKSILETDPVFGAERKDRLANLRRGGMNVYTTLDASVQAAGVQAMADWAPSYIEGMDFGAGGVTIEAKTGNVIAMVQNTQFTERSDEEDLPGYTGLVYASDNAHGGSNGFPVGSTYKIFTLLDWLEKGRSVNEVLNAKLQTFPTWQCHGVTHNNNALITNFQGDQGWFGTPVEFAQTSLNTGFLAMATQLDHCDINDIAGRLGVTRASDNSNLTDTTAYYDPLGSANIAPLAMAGAFATIANGGSYCTPRAIERIVDSEGNERELPDTSCTQVLSPQVAATAAYVLNGVMENGTGRPSRTGDGIPLLGKTGTHEDIQTSIATSSTEATTFVWVGNASAMTDFADTRGYDEAGNADLQRRYYQGVQLSQLRHRIAPVMQRAANAVYGGERFPAPDSNLTRRVLTDLPNVVGLPMEEAIELLEELGFDVVEGDPVDSDLPEGMVGAQTPEAGEVEGGTEVTLSRSTGMGVLLPDVVGLAPITAMDFLMQLGFTDIELDACEVDLTAPIDGIVTAMSPEAGTSANPNRPIRLEYSSFTCP